MQQNAFKNSLHVTSYTHILIHTYKNMYASATENLIKKYLQLMIQTFSPYVTYYSSAAQMEKSAIIIKL